LQKLNKDADKTILDGVVTDDYPVEVLLVSKVMVRIDDTSGYTNGDVTRCG
jgi:ParB family chromosome partitioning protein